jgi:hypothetical protein
LSGGLVDLAVVRERAIVVGRESDKEHVTTEIVFSPSGTAHYYWLRRSKTSSLRSSAARNSAPCHRHGVESFRGSLILAPLPIVCAQIPVPAS